MCDAFSIAEAGWYIMSCKYGLFVRSWFHFLLWTPIKKEAFGKNLITAIDSKRFYPKAEHASPYVSTFEMRNPRFV